MGRPQAEDRGLAGRAAALGEDAVTLQGIPGILSAPAWSRGSSKCDFPSPSCMLEVKFLGPNPDKPHQSLGRTWTSFPRIILLMQQRELLFRKHRAQPGSLAELGGGGAEAGGESSRKERRNLKDCVLVEHRGCF